MRDDDYLRWAYVIDDLIKGEYVELLFPTAEQARHAFRDCIEILDAIDLPYDAHRYILDMRIRVYGTVRFVVESDVATFRRMCWP